MRVPSEVELTATAPQALYGLDFLHATPNSLSRSEDVSYETFTDRYAVWVLVDQDFYMICQISLIYKPLVKTRFKVVLLRENSSIRRLLNKPCFSELPIRSIQAEYLNLKRVFWRTVRGIVSLLIR